MLNSAQVVVQGLIKSVLNGRDVHPRSVISHSDYEHAMANMSCPTEPQQHIVDLGSCVYIAEATREVSSISHSNKLRQSNLSMSMEKLLLGNVTTPVSEGFTSPEQFLQSESEEMGDEYATASNPFANDVYSIGGTMAMLILGSAQDYLSFSWTAEEAAETLMPKLEEQQAKGLSAEAVALLRRIVVEEGERPTIDELLQDAWFGMDFAPELLKVDTWVGDTEQIVKSGNFTSQYKASDWIVMETASNSEYIIKDETFRRKYKMPRDVCDLEPSERLEFENWKTAEDRGMKLFCRDTDRWCNMIRITEGIIDELHTMFPGQTTTYYCNEAYPDRAGQLRLLGGVPSNEDVANFFREKTQCTLTDCDCEERCACKLQLPRDVPEDNAWQAKRMYKPVVFAQQMKFDGQMVSTRGQHAHIPGRTKAFAYAFDEITLRSARHQGKSSAFVVRGDYLRIFQSRRTVACYTVSGAQVDKCYKLN